MSFGLHVLIAVGAREGQKQGQSVFFAHNLGLKVRRHDPRGAEAPERLQGWQRVP